MRPDLEKRIARLAVDRESGASEIVEEAIAILAEALHLEEDLPAVARAVCAAQPTMGPVWNAAINALAARERPERFTVFTQRLARAPDALARFSREIFGPGQEPLRIATISYSRTVLHVFAALAERRLLRVACTESRPALEGRKLALKLAALRVPVTFFTDAAIGHALGAVDAVLVGADAIGPEFFLNKSGTRMLAAAALHQGVPVYVLASRDKFVTREVAGRLQPREGPAADLWDTPPEGVTIRNPYFEATPLDLISAVITDIGVLGAGAVPDVCEATDPETPSATLALLRPF